MSENIKTCPFCDRKLEPKYTPPMPLGGGDYYFFWCKPCNMRFTGGMQLSKEKVIEAWNNRPISIQPPKDAE